MKYLDAEKISQRRTEMLSSLVHDISAPLFEALKKKIEYERSSLRAIIASDEKADSAKKELNKTLKSEYFVQRKLDTTHI